MLNVDPKLLTIAYEFADKNFYPVLTPYKTKKEMETAVLLIALREQERRSQRAREDYDATER